MMQEEVRARMSKRFRFWFAIVVSLAALLPIVDAARVEGRASDPWTNAQLISPAALNAQWEQLKGEKPLIVNVGFRRLYNQAHIPGALYFGPAAKPEGLAGLKSWAQKLSRNKQIILYCGCCPWKDCPNIRPAFQVLKEMGFTRLKVVSIATNFGVDWAGKGYAVEKGP